MTEVLGSSEVEKHLKKLDVEWTAVGGYELERVFDFEDFKSALEFVNKIGALAEKVNHHPNLELEWGKVVIKLTTHESGGLTQKDFKLAGAIDLMHQKQ